MYAEFLAMSAVPAGGAMLTLSIVSAANRSERIARARGMAPQRQWALPTRVREVLQRSLTRAAIAREPETVCEAGFCGVVVVAAATLWFGPVLRVLCILGAVAAGPVALWALRHRSRRRMLAAVPDALERVAAELRGGGTIQGAVEGVANEPGPLAPIMGAVGTQIRRGASLSEALHQWGDNEKSSELRAFAGALAVAATAGGHSAAALDGLASSVRERHCAMAEAHALSTQARLSAWVVGGAPVGFLAFSALVDPGSLDALLTSTAGNACLFIGVSLDALAFLWIRRIVRPGEIRI